MYNILCMNFDIPSLVRNRRRAVGMSQVELAAASDVSMSMIQLIEKGRSNPTVPVFRKILRALGLDVVVRSSFDWSQLVVHGGPLFSDSAKPASPPGRRDSQTLKTALLEACLHLEADAEHGTLDPRRREAVEAMLLAYRLHYPLRYARLEKKSPLIRKFGAFRIIGRHIKLKRIALEYMKEYL